MICLVFLSLSCTGCGKKVKELEPTRFPEPPVEAPTSEQPEVIDPDAGKSNSDILDELTGQMKLFND